MPPLYEQYRPKTFQEIVGQDRAVQTVQRIAARGLHGRVFWITGLSGQGKTTLARIIASVIANPLCVTEIDAQDLSLDLLRQWETQCHGKPLDTHGNGKRAYAYIVNEAHGMRTAVVNRLKTLFESDGMRNCVWVFTTTIPEAQQKALFDDEAAGNPFLSRSIGIVLNHGKELELDFALGCQKIAQKENLDGKPITEYVRLVRECKCNMRAVLQKIESGYMLA